MEDPDLGKNPKLQWARIFFNEEEGSRGLSLNFQSLLFWGRLTMSSGSVWLLKFNCRAHREVHNQAFFYMLFANYFINNCFWPLWVSSKARGTFQLSQSLTPGALRPSLGSFELLSKVQVKLFLGDGMTQRPISPIDPIILNRPTLNQTLVGKETELEVSLI